MNIEHVMTRDVVTVLPETPLKDVARILSGRRISGLPVVDGGRVVGVVSEGDILQKERATEPAPHGIFHRHHTAAARTKASARTAGEAMTAPAICVFAHRPVSEAAELMVDRGVNRLPVLAPDGTLAGIVTRADLVRAFARSDVAVAAEIRDLVSAPFGLTGQVTVHVEGGEVDLAGFVYTREVADTLVSAVEEVPGVVAVDSRLRWRVAAESPPQPPPALPMPL